MIKRLAPTALLLILTVCIAGCASQATGPTDPTDIGSWMEFYQVPGVSVAVIRDFKLDYVEVHGVKRWSTHEPVTQTTLFQAASLSKSVSAGPEGVHILHLTHMPLRVPWTSNSTG